MLDCKEILRSLYHTSPSTRKFLTRNFCSTPECLHHLDRRLSHLSGRTAGFYTPTSCFDCYIPPNGVLYGSAFAALGCLLMCLETSWRNRGIIISGAFLVAGGDCSMSWDTQSWGSWFNEMGLPCANRILFTVLSILAVLLTKVSRLAPNSSFSPDGVCCIRE